MVSVAATVPAADVYPVSNDVAFSPRAVCTAVKPVSIASNSARSVEDEIVELVDGLRRPRPAEVRAGSSRGTGDAAEGGDNGGLCGAHLEDEQEQDKDEQQQRADGEVDGGMFHALGKRVLTTDGH